MEHADIHRRSFNGKEVVLVGTAHVSKESADLVEAVIEGEKPDTVCVELCKTRLEALKNPRKWLETDIVKVIREKRTSVLLSQLLMASFQKRMAEKFDIRPGEEMHSLGRWRVRSPPWPWCTLTMPSPSPEVSTRRSLRQPSTACA